MMEREKTEREEKAYRENDGYAHASRWFALSLALFACAILACAIAGGVFFIMDMTR
jgi:hypothetical protein